MAFSFFLLRRCTHQNPTSCSRIPFFISQNFWYSNRHIIKPFSTSPSLISHEETTLPKLSDPKTSLSARMSFVFDQIDAIEKERSNKDEALQRIRAWRETKKKKNEDEISNISAESNLSSETDLAVKKKESLFKKEVEVVHPWPEWVELMERLVQQNYFDHRRRDEDKIVQDLSIDISSFPEEGFNFTRDWTAVRTACLNFGRDRFDILRSLSRQDIQILVGHGCPSTDKKVAFSGKMLRKHVHLDEGDVCSSCKMRSSCEKAYLLSRKEDEARTIDVIRILLTYGFDPINGSVENKALLKLKTVKTVVRKLLHEVVKLSAVPIDPNLPPPVIKKPPPKVKQPPPPPRKWVGRDDIEMKKGDWLCPKCDFMNFAKNNVCLQCDAKRPKRELLPGEWECPECNFLNYRRNMACFHCDHKRPPDQFMENQMQARQHGGPRTGLERVRDVPEGSNAWNFDFDDNESDGADVAAFEYADPPIVSEDSPVASHSHGGNVRGFEEDSFETSRGPRSNGRGRYLDHDQTKSGTGFNDFDDEEDDDVNSYELETTTNSSTLEPLRDFSEVEGYSESEDFDGSNHHSHAQQKLNSFSGNKQSRSVQRGAFLDSENDEGGFDSDGEPAVYSDRKSSRVGDPRNRIRGKGRSGAYRGNAFSSDSEPELNSDGDVGRGLRSNHNKWNSNERGFQRGGYSGSDSDDDVKPNRNKFGRNKAGLVRRGNTFNSHERFESTREEKFRSNDRRSSFGNADHGRSSRGSFRNDRESSEGRYSGRKDSYDGANRGRSSRGSFRNDRESSEGRYSGRRDSYDGANRGRSSRGSSRNDRESNEDGYGGRRANDRPDYMRSSGRGRQEEGHGFRKNGRSNGFNDQSDTAGGDERQPRKRVITR
ncbi:Zinc finger protein var3 protein [Thalictrum thalictroides]|uniref:Zinc finger protein var3 protein n=1 Tax=Thalictrum thalictroides TaxID=46969 RepID=A0A7J6X377_THATH|nr:Zinc finger protein var3 protein [Thalictrum thalictroides]